MKNKIKSNPLLWKLYCFLNNKILKNNFINTGNKSNHLSANLSLLNNAKIQIKGNNNKIILGTKVHFAGHINIQGNNNLVKIDDNCTIRKTLFWLEDDNNTVLIGNNTSIESKSEIAATEGKKIEIGSDCMISSEVFIRTGDSHSIVSELAGKRINYAADVKINNHVWLGHRVTITKGVEIGQNSVVASNALVTKKFSITNCIIGGFPAEILKENINWDKDRI